MTSNNQSKEHCQKRVVCFAGILMFPVLETEIVLTEPTTDLPLYLVSITTIMVWSRVKFRKLLNVR